MNKYDDIDNQYEAQIVEYNIDHPVCPECGTNMYKQKESYNIDWFHYEDIWYECPKCGHCTKF